MPAFAANLSFLWTELPILERFAAAARAGFRRVEILFVHELDPAALEAALRENHLELVLFDPRAGDWANGERGMLSIPGREEEFFQSVEEALANAKRFGTKQINALAGILPPGADRAAAFSTGLKNLRRIEPLLAQAGRTLLLENINTIDMPGYFLDTPARVAEMIAAVGSPHVRMQLDQYHAGMMKLDARAELKTHAALVRHAQIADAPGRHQPGTGAQPIAEFLIDLDQLGFGGAVGLEYKPQGSTEESLSWLKPTQRG